MSHFAETLQALLDLEKKTQTQLGEESGMDSSLISRMLRDRIPSRVQLERLVAAISADRARRIELLLAHLRDEAAAGLKAGIDDRHYILKSAEDDAPAIPGTLAAELELIADECVEHADIRAMIVDLAAMIRRHRAELADAGNLYPFAGFSDKREQVADPKSDAPSAETIIADAKRRQTANEVRLRSAEKRAANHDATGKAPSATP